MWSTRALRISNALCRRSNDRTRSPPSRSFDAKHDRRDTGKEEKKARFAGRKKEDTMMMMMMMMMMM